MAQSLVKKTVVFLSVAAVLTAVGAAIYFADRDIFWGALWFVFLASFVNMTAGKLASRRRRILLYTAVALLGVVWMLVNNAAYQLVAKNINSNPYGEYFVSQFEFRLRLSLFILKFISRVWLTDSRMVIVYILFIANAMTFPAVLKSLFLRLPHKYFEFFVHTSREIISAVRSYLATSFAQLLVNTFLWCLAAFLLRFDNFVILAAIMALCSFTPYFGLFFGAALAVVYVESGLFMLQLGGIFIAAASIWFVDHTLFRTGDPPGRIRLVVLLVSMPVGYALLSFPGLFAAAPFAHLAMLLSDKISAGISLIHSR